jgi:FSR family fosmidomycin resistance protein-like MFS transporter
MSSKVVEGGKAETTTPALTNSPPFEGGVARSAGVVVPAHSKPDMRLLGLLALGHMIVDINNGAIPALLPFLKSALSLSYTSAAVVVLMSNVTSSLIQPIFGYFADKTARRWILPCAVFLSAIGIGLTGLSTTYSVVLVMVIISGVGIASWHPEGYRTATRVAGERKATGISIFSTGGNIGIALGPPLVTALVTGFGLHGTLGLLIPGAVVALFLATALPRLTPARALQERHESVNLAKSSVYGMVLLILVVTMRSWTQTGFTTLVPFYYLDILKGDSKMVGTLLAIFLGSGAVGTLCAGPIADRFGIRRYAIATFLVATPLAIGFLFAHGAWIYLLLGALGFVLISTFTVTVVLAQAYMPRNLGMASGLIVGLATGAGGVGATVLGSVADHMGLRTALWISAIMPLAAFIASVMLPEPGAKN